MQTPIILDINTDPCPTGMRSLPLPVMRHLPLPAWAAMNRQAEHQLNRPAMADIFERALCDIEVIGLLDQAEKSMSEGRVS